MVRQVIEVPKSPLEMAVIEFFDNLPGVVFNRKELPQKLMKALEPFLVVDNPKGTM